MSLSPEYKLKYYIWKYCVKHKGKWWAKLFSLIPFFWFDANKEVEELYTELKDLDPETMRTIIQDGRPAYQIHVDYAKNLKETLERQMEQARLAERTCEYTNSRGERDCTNPKQSGSCLCEMHNFWIENIEKVRRLPERRSYKFGKSGEKLEQATKEKSKRNLARIFFSRFKRKVMRRKQ